MPSKKQKLNNTYFISHKSSPVRYVEGRGYTADPSEKNAEDVFSRTIHLSALIVLITLLLKFTTTFIYVSSKGDLSFENIILPQCPENVSEWFYALLSKSSCYIIAFIMIDAILKIPKPSEKYISKPKKSQREDLFIIGIMLIFAAIFSIFITKFGFSTYIDLLPESLISGYTLAGTGMAERFILCIIWIIISAFLNEFLVHSSLFKVYMQFGENSALLFSSLISAMLFSSNILLMIYGFIISFISGKYVIKKNSVFSGIIIRIIFSIIVCGSLSFENTLDKSLDWDAINWIYIFAAFLLSAVLMIISGIGGNLKNYLRSKNKNMFSVSETFQIICSDIFPSVILIICIVVAVYGTIVK